MARNAHPEVTRNRILDAAQQLFITKGYEHTSIQNIVDELGDLSKGAIYHHFKSKEDILEELINRDNDVQDDFNESVMGRSDLTALEKFRILWHYSVTAQDHVQIMRAAMPMLSDPVSFAAKLTMRWLPGLMAALALAMVPQGIVFLLPVGAWTKLMILIIFTCGTMIACCFTNLIAVPTIQLNTPEVMTGKVMSMAAAVSMCAQPLGQMVYGWAYDRMPVAAVLFISTVLFGIITAMLVPLSKQFED